MMDGAAGRRGVSGLPAPQAPSKAKQRDRGRERGGVGVRNRVGEREEDEQDYE